MFLKNQSIFNSMKFRIASKDDEMAKIENWNFGGEELDTDQ